MNKQYTVFSIYLWCVFANYGMNPAGQCTSIESLYQAYPIVAPDNPYFDSLQRSFFKIAASEHGRVAARGMLNAWNQHLDGRGWQESSAQWKNGVSLYCVENFPTLFATNSAGKLCFNGGASLYSLQNLSDDVIARHVGIYCYDNRVIAEEAQSWVRQDARYYEEWRTFFASSGISLGCATQQEIDHHIAVNYGNSLAEICSKMACATLARIVHSAPADTNAKKSIHEIWKMTEKSLKLGAYAHAIMGYVDIVSQQSLARH